RVARCYRRSAAERSLSPARVWNLRGGARHFAGVRRVQAARVDLNKRHQFRLVLCGHKAVEAGAVCLVLMVQGHLMDATLAHLLIATKTGMLAMSPALGLTFTRYARQFANKWAASIFIGVCTFLADGAIHAS